MLPLLMLLGQMAQKGAEKKEERGNLMQQLLQKHAASYGGNTDALAVANLEHKQAKSMVDPKMLASMYSGGAGAAAGGAGAGMGGAISGAGIGGGAGGLDYEKLLQQLGGGG